MAACLAHQQAEAGNRQSLHLVVYCFVHVCQRIQMPSCFSLLHLIKVDSFLSARAHTTWFEVHLCQFLKEPVYEFVVDTRPSVCSLFSPGRSQLGRQLVWCCNRRCRANIDSFFFSRSNGQPFGVLTSTLVKRVQVTSCLLLSLSNESNEC